MQAPDIRVYLGKGGCGKSTLARAHLSGARRVLIHDLNGEDAHAVGAFVVTNAAELVELMARPGPMRICWRYDARSEEAVAEQFEFANRCAWMGGDVWVLWDEVDRLTGLRGQLPGMAYRLVNQGRHRDVRLLACSRRPALVPRGLTASATRIVAFRTTEPRDVAYLRETMGDVALQLRALGDHDYVDWTDRKIDVVCF